MDTREYITYQQALTEYGVNRTKLRRWVLQGRLPAYQSGSDLRFKYVRRSDLEQLLGLQEVDISEDSIANVSRPVPRNDG